ncbi:prostate-associated microseminoprotein [Poecilia latipinna]|uniref:Prostate-associated microseminoprotein n=2 Tax=Poecilia TaxID=8080 RepID=A0A3B3YB34_9TELE|nr:PREDICTED: prostate-associated microseminoprotein [Poecilia formosa]XP_014866230.1 PREDICTED: prostate-associated microseminoprotein [Poecilia mexicana]XP_014883418.1 PREDICTED: prostate-associated microseminoprotein [Poecilia latipinna]
MYKRGTIRRRGIGEKMKMELAVVNWMVAAAGFLLLWAGGGSAAPLECHFNSRALCEFEGRQYALGETWMDNACMQCTCLHPVGVGCCETVHRPVDFPAWCEVRVEPVTCKVFLVQTADPRLPCTPGETDRDPSHGSLQLQLDGGIRTETNNSLTCT